MRTEKEIAKKLLRLQKEQKKLGRETLSSWSPRKQGKSMALRWVLENVEDI